MEGWSPYTKVYKPLAAGSIDGTDTEPHDHGIVRAMSANYTPAEVDSNSENTLFVGRLPHSIGEDELHEKFSRFGKLKSVCVTRDVVTGQSKGYGFVEYSRKSDAMEAWKLSQHLEIEGFRLIVDKEAGHTLKGWIPRRLGGGWGGRKEAGQLRFGCVERPWRKPIILPQHSMGSSAANDGNVRLSDRDNSKDKVKLLESNRGQHPYKIERGKWGYDRHHEYERSSDRHDKSDYRYDKQEGKFSHYTKREERGRDYREKDNKGRDYKRRSGRDHEYGDLDSKDRGYNRYEGKEYSSRQDKKDKDSRWKERDHS
ncbi:U11/U12 small nuclear ribonucleoprotein 35 kDa protein-like [Macrobrachium rosenbergii]|uniref:U11/U12 small nuclear ribonucleoprotein 35 kDa protein-like n=1 Tax=Macrobrachium rosenbergii TaxID=79674 RepID=UPI0034D5D17F